MLKWLHMQAKYPGSATLVGLGYFYKIRTFAHPRLITGG